MKIKNKLIRYGKGYPFAILLGAGFGFIPALLSTNAAIIMVPIMVVALVFQGINGIKMFLSEQSNNNTTLQETIFVLSMIVSMTCFWRILN